MAAAFSSSQKRYEVFLSFRGDDTRNNFTAHLLKELRAKGINTFFDEDKLERGCVISPALITAIENSMFSIIVLSENYASSRWCLEEMVKILECNRSKEERVLPIFYNVDPSDVGNHRGKFGEALAKHEENLEENRERVKIWRDALTEVANLSGWDSRNKNEAQLIKKVIKKVLKKLLNASTSDAEENLVGMRSRKQELRMRLSLQSDDVRMVGICGMGGIGKTTLARAFYRQIFDQFEACSFLEIVNDFKEQDLTDLEKKLLSQLLEEENLNIEGPISIKGRLRSRKVLIVLDNVNNLTILERLAGDCDWFCPGSIIIITTRDQGLLIQHKVDYYKIAEFNGGEALSFLKKHSLKHELLENDFFELSKEVIQYAQGLPLALKVLASFLFSLSKDEWRDYLVRLKSTPNMKIQEVLRISYDGLEDNEKNIFLDIACFFKGENKDYVMEILDGCKFSIRTLIDKSLITISANKLEMHDLLQEMGKQIVCQECLEKPGSRSRLWKHDDVYRVLTKNLGTEEIEGIFLDMSKSEHIQFTTKAFKKMNRLRLLKIHQDATYNSIVKSLMVLNPSQVHLSETHITEDFESPFFELRYLHWDGYALQSLPLNFHAKKLVKLNLRFSNIRQLWKGQVFHKLKVMNLSYSQHLIKFPKFSSVPNLKILILEGCISLESLPRDFYKLQCLQILSCRGCTKVKRFVEIEGNMRKLRKLNLSGTAIVEVPLSIKHLNGLEDLDLGCCENLVTLPKSICSLRSLKTLKLNDCSKLSSFLEIKGGDMENLRELDLNSTAIVELSSSIGHLKALEYLSLAYCKSLVSLPDSLFNLTSLKILEVHGCSKLENLPKDLGQLQCLEKLSLADISCELPCLSGLCSLRSLRLTKCNLTQGVLQSNNCLSSLEVLRMGNCKAMEIEILNLIFHLSSLQTLDLSNCNLMEGEIPSDISHLSSLDELYLGGNHFSSIPTSIIQLSRLVGLDLCHCKKLLQIPELPSSLRLLDAHSPPGTLSSPSFLPLHSLVNCFKSAIQDLEYWGYSGALHFCGSIYSGKGICIVIPGSSGIPEWISMQEMGSEVTVELPENWYQKNDFLGFALCCVYVSVDDEPEDESKHESVHLVENESGDEFQNEPENESGDESELESGDGFETEVFEGYDPEVFDGYDPEVFPSACRFKCALTVHGDQSKYVDHLSFYSECDKCHADDNDSVSDQVWVICYPKVAIDRRYRSDQCTHFMASFKGFYNCGERTFKVKKCGIRLIYAQDFQ